MSRAVHHLEMIIEPKDKLGDGANPANVLRSALAPDQPASDRATLWSRRSDDDWAAHLNASTRTEAPAARERIELVLRRPDGVRAARLQGRSPSSMEGGRRLDLADEMRLPGAGAALDRGTLLHAWFEAIEWIEDGTPDDGAMADIAAAPGVAAAPYTPLPLPPLSYTHIPLLPFSSQNT